MVSKTRSQEVVFLLMLFVVPLSQLAIDIYTPSLPAMQAYFSVDTTLVQLTVSIYVLSLGLGQIVWGALSDTIGRRPILIAGTAVFLVGSVMAVVAPSIWILFLSRVLQGIGAAASNSVSRAVVSDIYSGKKLMSRISIVAGVWSLAPIVAPFIGGFLGHYINWQANFVLLSVYTLIVLLALCFYLQETNTQRKPWNTKQLALNYCTVIFHKKFMGCLLNLVMLLAIILVFNTVAPFIYEVTYDYTSAAYGIVALSMGVGIFLGTYLNRTLVKHYTPPIVLHFAQAITIVASLWIMIAHQLQLPLMASFTIPMFIIFFIQGTVGPTAMGYTLNIFRHMGGIASAALGVLMYAGSALILTGTSHLNIITETAVAILFLIFAIMGIAATTMIYDRKPKADISQ